MLGVRCRGFGVVLVLVLVLVLDPWRRRAAGSGCRVMGPVSHQRSSAFVRGCILSVLAARAPWLRPLQAGERKL